MKSKSNAVCRYILARKFEDVRWKLICIFLALLLFDGEWQANSFCSTLNIGVAPWLFPHMTSWMALQFTFVIGFLIIVCDLPMVNDSTLLAVVRSGSEDWAKGVLKSLILIVLFYLTYILLTSVLVILPSIEIGTGWGKALNTFAKQPGVSPFKIFPISPRIVSSYTPLVAMVLSLTLEALCLIFLTLIMLVVNLLFDTNRMGLYVSLCITSLDFFFYNDVGDKAMRFSPVSLARLSVLDATNSSYYPPLQYALIVLTSGCVLLSVIFMHLFKKKGIEMK